MEHRQRECGGLAGSGRRLAQHVVAGDERRNRLALDVGRLFVAEGSDRRDERVESECEERAICRVGGIEGRGSHIASIPES